MISNLITQFAASCGGGKLLGFPTWYKYLDGQYHTDPFIGITCSPEIHGLKDIWLIVAAVIEILLRIAALAAIAFVVWGGVQYITSEGQPEKTATARKTLINALVGLVIAVSATAIVTFIAGRFKSG